MNKALRKLAVAAFLAFTVYLLVKHPHSVPQFIHGLRSHR